MASGFDIWGALASAIGTLGLFSTLFAIIKSQLPSVKLRVLDQTLAETVVLFRTSVEDQLLKDMDFITETEDRLSALYGQTEELRNATYSASSNMMQLKALCRGLSQKISIVCEEAKGIRCNIVTTTSEERERLMREGNLSPSSILSGVSRSIRAANATTPSNGPLDPLEPELRDSMQCNAPPVPQIALSASRQLHAPTCVCRNIASICPPQTVYHESDVPGVASDRGSITSATTLVDHYLYHSVAPIGPQADEVRTGAVTPGKRCNLAEHRANELGSRCDNSCSSARDGLVPCSSLARGMLPDYASYMNTPPPILVRYVPILQHSLSMVITPLSASVVVDEAPRPPEPLAIRDTRLITPVSTRIFPHPSLAVLTASVSTPEGQLGEIRS